MKGDGFDNADIVVDLGATNLRAGFVDAQTPIIDTRTDVSREGALSQLKMAIETLANQAISPPAKIFVGAPGLVTIDGKITKALYSPISAVDLVRELTSGKRAELEVQVENDANLQAVGAASLKGFPAVHLHISIGSGVGAGITLNGSIIRGSNGFASEIGHMSVRNEIGSCECGRRNCLDLLLSGVQLKKRFGDFWWEGRIDQIKIDFFNQVALDLSDLLIQVQQLLDLSIITFQGNIFNIPHVSDILLEPSRKLGLPVDVIYQTAWILSAKGAKQLRRSAKT